MVGPPHATFDVFQVVAHTLEEALDLLVIVLRRNAFDFLSLPAELALDDVDVLLGVPFDVAAEADRAALDPHQLLARRIDEWIEVALGDAAAEKLIHVVGGDAEIHGAVKA